MLAVIEGLAQRRSWEEIGLNWERLAPSSAPRLMGPWTPPFAEALKKLEADERRARGRSR